MLIGHQRSDCLPNVDLLPIPGYKKSKNKNRGTHSKYVHLLKQQKSRMTALKAGLATPLSAVHGGGAYASGSMDVGEYESGVARSRNASPTHHYYRQDRWVSTKVFPGKEVLF